MKNKISEKDLKDWHDFTTSKEKIQSKDLNINNLKKKDRLTIDLHGYTLSDANLAIKKIISKAYSEGVDSLNIITGKGSRSKSISDPYKSKDLSILKYSVPEFIFENEEIRKKIKKINIDEINNNNKGNFIIYLKKK